MHVQPPPSSLGLRSEIMTQWTTVVACDYLWESSILPSSHSVKHKYAFSYHSAFAMFLCHNCGSLARTSCVIDSLMRYISPPPHRNCAQHTKLARAHARNCGTLTPHMWVTCAATWDALAHSCERRSGSCDSSCRYECFRTTRQLGVRHSRRHLSKAQPPPSPIPPAPALGGKEGSRGWCAVRSHATVARTHTHAHTHTTYTRPPSLPKQGQGNSDTACNQSTKSWRCQG